MEGLSPETQAAVEDRLRELLAAQPWWRRYANTATAVVTNLVLIVWLILGAGITMPTWLQWGVAAILFAGNVLGVRKTPNGLTPSLIELIQGRDTGGRHRK